MAQHIKCKHDSCNNPSLSLAEFCWEHLPDRAGYVSRIVTALKNGEDLSGYNLQKIVMDNVHLERPRLAGAHLCQADLSGSHIFDADLNGADLLGTNLSDCELTHCNLKGADLTKASLAGSRLWNADLTNANLNECNLSACDLWNARLHDAKLWHTSFDNAKSITKKSFGTSQGFLDSAKINEAGVLSAEESYRDLKRYFLINAMNNDASWASFKEKTMERLIMKKRLDLNYIPSLLMAILCGYGEKPYRIVLSALSTILLFALSYYLLNAIQSSSSPDYILRWGDYLYYSAVTFTTVGYGDFIPKPATLFRLLAACEAFSGVYLSGLFIFTLARKYSAR